MAISKEKKDELIKEYARHDGDTGSPEVQIALLTSDINNLNAHLKANKRNAAELSKLRTAVRKFNEAVENDAKDVLDLEVKATRALDKAASKGLISKNKANRDKSRLSKKAANK